MKKIKWYDADELLPPIDEVVLVRDPEERYTYIVSQLMIDDGKLIFQSWSDVIGYAIPAGPGVLWLKLIYRRGVEQ